MVRFHRMTFIKYHEMTSVNDTVVFRELRSQYLVWEGVGGKRLKRVQSLLTYPFKHIGFL